MAELSKTMRRCIQSMKVHGGSIQRHAGGFWRCEPAGGFGFGTSTVEALVSRGVAEYSEWKDGRSGRFPIKATLKADSPVPAVQTEPR